MVAWGCKNDSHEGLSSWGTSQLIPAFLEEASRLLSGSPSLLFMSFLIWCFCTGFHVEWGLCLCEPFKNMFSIPWSSIVFSNVVSIGFKSQLFGGGLSLLFSIYRFGCLKWSSIPLLLREKKKKNCTFVIIPDCKSPQLGCRFYLWWNNISASLTCLNAVLLSFVVETLFI